MILFVVDNHFGTHAGRNLWRQLSAYYDTEISEDSWDKLVQLDLRSKYELLVLHAIGGTSGVPEAPDTAADAVRRYVNEGGNLLLLHASSAVFRRHSWWRDSVGYRWVRSGDPDSAPVSQHPICSYEVSVRDTCHKLGGSLSPLSVENDEALIALQPGAPTQTLMTTVINDIEFVQCYEVVSQVSKLVGYLPGHRREVVENPANVRNCRVLVDYLLGERRDSAE